MEYDFRAVGNRCGLVISDLQLGIEDNEVINLLKQLGFQILLVDTSIIARSVQGASVYKEGASWKDAPSAFDCSFYMKWIYSYIGIELPRHTYQQREIGKPVMLNDLQEGDLVFTTGKIPYYKHNPNDGVGHVGMVTDKKTILHATSSRNGVVECSIDTFIKRDDRYRGARRILPNHCCYTVVSPPGITIERSSDIKVHIWRNVKALRK